MEVKKYIRVLDENEKNKFKTNFVKALRNKKKLLKKLNNNVITHGIEIEGFFLNKDYTLNNNLTKQILKNSRYGFQDELGNSQLEFGTSPVILKQGMYNKLLSEVKEIKGYVSDFAEKNDSYFITKAIPPFLEFDPENNSSNFNEKEIYTLEVDFWKEYTKTLDFYNIMDKENKVVCKLQNDNKSLAFVSGIHINIRPLNLEHCRKLFNVSLSIMPYLTGLATNGGFLNKILDKKDYRLHIGILGENLLNENYVYDSGLPDFYLDDIFDYFNKQLVKEPIYQVNNTDLEQSVIDSFRETSWSFIQIKIQNDNLLLEYRPISVQMTSELIVSFHIYSLILFEYFINRYDDILLTPIKTLHKDLTYALKHGSDAIINHENQEIKIFDLFEKINNDLFKFVVDNKYLSKEEFNTIIYNIENKLKTEDFYNNNIKEYIIDSHKDKIKNVKNISNEQPLRENR